MLDSPSRSKTSRPVKVYLAGLGRLPKAILDALLDTAADIEVIGDLDSDPEAILADAESERAQALLARVYELDPDVVILGVRGGLELEAVKRLLATRVLVLATRGKQLLYCRVDPEARELEEVTAEELISLIREAGSA